MANNKSAIKRNLQNEKRRIYNRDFRNRTRTMVKRARAAIAKGDVSVAETATRMAVRELDKNASRGILHKRNAARRKSRLMRRLAAIKAATS